MTDETKKRTTRPRESGPKQPTVVNIGDISDAAARKIQVKGTANGSGWSLTKKLSGVGLSLLIGAVIVLGYLVIFSGSDAPVKDTAADVPANLSIEAEAMAKTDEAFTSIDTANGNVDDAENKLDEAEAEPNKAKARTFASRAKVLLKDAKGDLRTADTNLDQAKTLINTKWANKVRDPGLKVQVQSRIETLRDDYDLAQADYDEAEARVNAILNPPVAKATENTTPQVVYIKVPANTTETKVAVNQAANPVVLNPGASDLDILKGGI